MAMQLSRQMQQQMATMQMMALMMAQNGGAAAPSATGLAPTGWMQRDVMTPGHGGNIDSRGLPLSIFGTQWGCCPPLFDKCTDDQLMMLFNGLGAVEPALRWLGFRKAMAIKEKKAYLTYVGPAGAALGNPVDGLPDTICGPGDRLEMGKPCYIEFCGFGEIRLTANELKDGGQNVAWCKERDVWTLDFGEGARQVANDEEWWLAVMSNMIVQFMATRLLIGDSTNTYLNTTVPVDSDGLLKLLTRTYPTCPGLKGFILDWGGNPACDYSNPNGMTGITLNGVPLTGKYAMNLFKTTLRAIHNITSTRLGRVPMINRANVQYGDFALLGPEYANECLIDCGVCDVVCRDDITRIDSEAAAMKREEWLAAGEGWGSLWFNRFETPFIPFNPPDWKTYDVLNPEKGIRGVMENADGTINLLALWRGVGGNNGRRFLIPEYNDLSDGTKETANNGQFQMWDDECGRCYTISMATEWRWYLDAPFLQTLVTNVKCDTLLPSYYGLGALEAATSNC